MSIPNGKVDRPITILQYGEGNFLRAFVDYMVDVANEQGVYNGNIVIVKPIEYGNLEAFYQQNCNYNLILRGQENGETKVTTRLVTAVADAVDCYTEYRRYLNYADLDSLQIIVSNTTEAGIVYDEEDALEDQPPKSYPAKLTQFLYHRYLHFKGAADKGLLILPVELIDYNGRKLLDCVERLSRRWQLEDGFLNWLHHYCQFCDTLVDRIVTGYPKEEAGDICMELGYQDLLLDTGEQFALWVIECQDIELGRSLLPLEKAGLPIVWTKDVRPYKERKVRVLNGAHTSFVPAAFLAGQEIVLDCMRDTDLRTYIERVVFDEIVPTVHLPEQEVRAFADSVLERFENPFIRHYLTSIALNSVSKWAARVLPSLKDSLCNTGRLPRYMTFSFAALLAFYTGDVVEDHALIGRVNGRDYRILDDEPVLRFFAAYSTAEPVDQFVAHAASRVNFWGEDLSALPGFVEQVSIDLSAIRAHGARRAIRLLNRGELA